MGFCSGWYENSTSSSDKRKLKRSLVLTVTLIDLLVIAMQKRLILIMLIFVLELVVLMPLIMIGEISLIGYFQRQGLLLAGAKRTALQVGWLQSQEKVATWQPGWQETLRS